MKKLFRAAAAGLAVLIAASGCTAAPAATSSASSASGAAPAVSENFNQTGYPIVNEAVTYRLMVSTHPLSKKNMADKEIIQKLEEKTNVKIQWEEVPTEGWSEKINLAVNSGNLPDGTFSATPNMPEAIKSNLILPLDDYLQYMPNYTKTLEVTPEINMNSRALSDGKLYVVTGAEPVGEAGIELPLFINKKWLDHLKLEVPTTTEEYYQVLKAFQEQDANGNGDPNDEIPLDTGEMWGEMTLTWLFSAWGMMASKNEVMTTVRDGKLDFNPVNSKYQDALNYMHRLYAEGLINEEFLTQPQNVRHALNKVDPTVYGSFIEWDSSMLTMPENTDEYEVILPLKGPDGDQLWTQGTRRLNLNPALVVFQNCENPEILLRWIDTFQEPEFVHSSHLGPEGYLWEIDPETKEYVQPKDSIDALTSAGSSIEEYSATECIFGAISNRDPRMTGNEIRYKGTNKETKAVWSQMYEPYIFPDYYPPYLSIMESTEESKEVGLMWEDLKAYVNSFMADAITNGVTDEQFAAHVKQCESLNYSTIVAYYQKQYDRMKEIAQ